MKCQDVAIGLSGTADEGDSGSPVFRVLDSPLPSDVSLYGIVWGTTLAEDSIIYSPMDQIQNFRELGSIRTCALEIGC